MKQSISWIGNVMTLAYSNGDKRELDCEKLPAEIFTPCAAARHGIQQKLGDAYSSFGGAGGNHADKLANLDTVIGALQSGDWNRKGGNATAMEVVQMAYEYLAGLAGVPEKAGQWFDAYQKATPEKQAELRGKPQIKNAIDVVKAQRKLAGAETPNDFDPNA